MGRLMSMALRGALKGVWEMVEEVVDAEGAGRVVTGAAGGSGIHIAFKVFLFFANTSSLGDFN